MSSISINKNKYGTSAQAQNAKWFREFSMCVFAVVAAYLLLSNPAFATGGTGAVTAATARVSTVATGFFTILQAIGVVVLSSAFLYVGYGMAFNGKKWSDVANVFYGATIAGMGSMLVGWLFS